MSCLCVCVYVCVCLSVWHLYISCRFFSLGASIINGLLRASGMVGIGEDSCITFYFYIFIAEFCWLSCFILTRFGLWLSKKLDFSLQIAA